MRSSKSTFFTSRLTAEGASALSKLRAAVYARHRSGLRSVHYPQSMKVGPRQIAGLLAKGTKSIVPVSATIFFAYCISNLFESIHVGENIGNLISSWGFGLGATCIYPATVYRDPWHDIARLLTSGDIWHGDCISHGRRRCQSVPCSRNAAGHLRCDGRMTPPLALCMYTAMGISGSEMKQTTQNCVIWCVLHYLLSVVFLIGIVPLFGMV